MDKKITFLNEVVNVLKMENEERKDLKKSSEQSLIDIPFVIAPLHQYLEREDEYIEFVSDISKYHYNLEYIPDNNEGYTNGSIMVSVFESALEYSYLGIQYKLEFTLDDRFWKFCGCTHLDPDYRKDKECCGHGCDWVAPGINIKKIIDVSSHDWDGDEHDYWVFEDSFYEKNKNLKISEENKRKMQEINSLSEQIKELQSRLNELIDT